MSVARPPVAMEKFRSRIYASSRATVFEVVQGNDKLVDTPRLSDTDDMRSSRNRRFAFATSAAAANGQTRRDSKGGSDRDIPSSALGCLPGALVSCFEFIDSAQFHGQVRPRADVPLHALRTIAWRGSGPAFPLPEEPTAARAAQVRVPHLPSRSLSPTDADQQYPSSNHLADNRRHLRCRKSPQRFGADIAERAKTQVERHGGRLV